MAIFNRVNKAAISPPVAKAAASGGYATQNNKGVGNFYNYSAGQARNKAMSVAAISRSRDLMASVLACMDLKMYTEIWNGQEMEQVPLAPRSWLSQLDPKMPNTFSFPWVFDDLFFFGRSMLYITARTADGYMASATRLPQGSISTTDMTGPVWFGKSDEIYFNGNKIPTEDVVQILSPTQGMIYMSEQTIATALKLEAARYRNADSAIPAGVLAQRGGEPLSATELADLAAAFNAARATNQTAALNEFLTYTETTATPDKMLLIEAANYQALECARLCNVPPFLLGISTGSYAYTNSRSAKSDLWYFGLSMYAKAITAALSQQLPRGTHVEFNFEKYLMDYSTEEHDMNMPKENTQESLA